MSTREPRARGGALLRSEFSSVPNAVELPVLQLIHAEQAAGLMLLVGAVLALAWANSPWAASYEALQTYSLPIFLSEHPVLEWVNSGLMTLFFLLVGLEVKRELVHGQLSTWRQAALPVGAALGGMVVPAAVYLAFNLGGENAQGWGVPVATDIAFAMGMMGLLGRRVPQELKIFLLAFAAADDVGGVIIIATVYTGQLDWLALGGAIALACGIFGLRRLRLQYEPLFMLVGVGMWLCTFKSGVHATIAGVVYGLLVPARPRYQAGDYVARARKHLDDIAQAASRRDDGRVAMLLGQMEALTVVTEPPVVRLDRLIRPWVSYLVLPLFALTNAGVEMSWDALNGAATSPVGVGIAAALVVGKFVGVAGASWASVKAGALLPQGVGWGQMLGASVLAGIGFSVSLFIANLAFDAEALGHAKVAILVGSAAAALAGVVLLWTAGRGAVTESGGRES